MASSALEEKINKIRQQNEEIRRRYEEVEEDKKNAAKLNALVQMVPSTDWPERKEPPEFSNPPKTKPKSTKEKYECTLQSHGGEGKKIHSFAQGEGPPPDPKYNFLADSEREEPTIEYTKENSGNRSHHKATRGSFRKKISGREGNQKDIKPNKGNYRDESQPGYDAWRAERNRIDEDRISRQRTAEGNWRREWDNDKVHIIDDGIKKSSRPTLGDFTKKDHKDSDRKYHANNNEYVNYTRGGGHRAHRGSTKNFYSNYENRSHNTYDQHRNNTAASAKTSVSPTSEERTVIATDKSIKVTVNQSNLIKGPVMSVKVNSPSIAGTGRVGPRQRTRVTYSHSDVDVPPSEGESFFRQKSFEDKSKGTYFNNQKFSNLKRSHSQKKKENETKYQYHQRKDIKKEDSDGNSYKHYDNEFKSYTQKDQQRSYSSKSPKLSRGNMKITKHDSSSVNASQKRDAEECSTSDQVKLEQNFEPNIEHNREQNPEQNTEHDIAEDSNTLQETKSEANESFNMENVQSNIENDITKKGSSTKDGETEKIFFTPISGTDNPEYIAEDSMNKNNVEDKEACSDSLANNVTEDLQKNSNTSSEVSVPDNVQSNEELMPNASNEVLNNIVAKNTTFLHEDDQQSSEQITKQLVNDDCDNIESEVTVQRSIEEVTDNSVSLFEDKTCSVIESNNQSVCNNELVQEEQLVQKETLNIEKQTDLVLENKTESPNQNLEDALNFCEIKSENSLSPANMEEDLVEDTKEKIEKMKDEKEEKVNEENEKTYCNKNSTSS
ncbi:uncharacterized protein LOC100741686 isoform X2 [Bombus impatiens]|nr:uncharacterized protein LOC100741686 isoform X2 [Bombus impatiens]XP_012241262.1 uncharacterized protein LOC100741686 isoform X2 [Bombus impatiens]XP_012241273.1 uncharacterized protein LOC100741686 isoform X2 [Bombus impatiens]